MQAETTSRLPERQNRTRLAVRVAALALGAGIALVAVVLAGFPEPMPRLVLVAVLTSLMLAAAAAGRHGLRQYRRRAETALIADLVRHDPAPALLVADDGGILSLNEAACSRFGGAKGNALSHCLRGLAANPSALIFRLHARARLSRTAHEDIAAPGGPLRLSVAALSSGYLWRIGNPPGAAAPRGERDAFPVPALTVARSGAILTMNRAARALVGGRAKTIDALFARQPLVSGEANEIVTASGAFGVAVACREFGEGRCELFVLPVARDASRGSGAIASLPVPMMKIAPSGRILAVNDQARALLGLDIGPDTRLGDLMEGLGRPIEDWLHAAGAGFADKNSEFLRLSRNDAEVYVQVSLGRVTEDGEPVLIALLNDATELKTLEAQFVQSQ
ncbi:MAG: PAS domain-containing protein, partial [Pseudooceanicola sp.]|nr:PAS domain-containing protein [Pseudooceanicola sp.]